MESTIQSRVLLLYGGYWDEREISVATAAQVADALRGAALRLTPVRWDADGWVVLPDDEENLTVPGMGRQPLEVLRDIRSDGLGVVFNALHGGPGEDGTLQGLLDMAGIPYTGAGVHGSAISSNKATFRYFCQSIGLPVAPGAVVSREVWEESSADVLASLVTEITLPAILKPISGGSSFGIVKVTDADELSDGITAMLATSKRVVVERFILGREISFAVLGTRVGAPLQILPPVEIEPLSEAGFFDAEAKYVPGKARETIPAPLDPALSRTLTDGVALLHREMDLGGVSRTDIIIGPDGPVFLETNTVPGLTSGSLLPQMADAIGLSLTALCRRLIDYALSVHLARTADTTGGIRS